MPVLKIIALKIGWLSANSVGRDMQMYFAEWLCVHSPDLCPVTAAACANREWNGVCAPRLKIVCPRKSNNVCEERTRYIMLCFSYSLPQQACLATSWLPLPARNVVCGLQEIRGNERAGTGKINKRTQRGCKLFKALVAVHTNKQVQEVKGGSLNFRS